MPEARHCAASPVYGTDAEMEKRPNENLLSFYQSPIITSGAYYFQNWLQNLMYHYRSWGNTFPQACEFSLLLQKKHFSPGLRVLLNKNNHLFPGVRVLRTPVQAPRPPQALLIIIIIMFTPFSFPPGLRVLGPPL